MMNDAIDGVLMDGKAAFKLLIIDGTPESQTSISAAVRTMLPGVAVLTAAGSPAGIDLAYAEDPDIIVINASTPHADGLAVCLRLRDDDRLKDIPVALVAKREAGAVSPQDALASGARGFLAAPLDPAEFVPHILAMAKVKSANRGARMGIGRIDAPATRRVRTSNEDEPRYQNLVDKMMNAFALHEMIFDSSGEPVDYRFIEVNPAWERTVGIEAREVIGKRIKEIMPTVEDKWIQLYGRVVKTQRPEDFTDYNAATDKYYHVYAYCPSPGKFAVFFIDVTEQRRAEARLTESETKFRSIAERLIDLIALADEKGVITYASPASATIFDMAPEEMVGRNFTSFVDESSIPKALGMFQTIQEGGSKIVGQEVTLKKPDGSLFFGELTGAAHTFGATRGVLVTIRDITERKQAEKRILNHQSRLQSLVRILQHQTRSAQEFLDYALNEIIQITESELGYIYFYSEEKKEFSLNTWSKKVMDQCSVTSRQTMYSLERTGIWGEAVRQRKEIIINDFGAPHPLKKGYPDGHVPLRNFLTVPIFSGSQIVAVAGVANKKGDYSNDDMLQMQLLMNSVWKEVESKRSLQAWEASEERFRIAQELSPDGFTILHPLRNDEGEVTDFSWVYENQAAARINGTNPEEVKGKRLLDFFPAHRESPVFETYIRAAATGVTQVIEEAYAGNIIAKPLWLRIVVERMGEDIAIMAIDITEQRENTERLRMMLNGTVQAISLILEARDPYTAGHERRVADLAAAIAARMKLPRDRIEGLHTACLLHDIGKITIPVEILSMPRELSPIEFSLIKAHSQAGYHFLKDIEFPWPVARMVLEHHERMDGSGYPTGAKGGDLLLESRILAVADVVEAISSHRPYRPARGVDAALKELEEKRGVLYDPDVVEACLYLFNEQNYVM